MRCIRTCTLFKPGRRESLWQDAASLALLSFPLSDVRVDEHFNSPADIYNNLIQNSIKAHHKEVTRCSSASRGIGCPRRRIATACSSALHAAAAIHAPSLLVIVTRESTLHLHQNSCLLIFRRAFAWPVNDLIENSAHFKLQYLLHPYTRLQSSRQHAPAGTSTVPPSCSCGPNS